MTMNVQNSQFKLGIDTGMLREVSAEILKRAAEKNNQYINTGSVNTIFKPADIGIDLYKGTVDNNTARQIAMNNSGLSVQLNQNVLDAIRFLNTQASVHKSVEGKITVAVNSGETAAETKIVQTPSFNQIVSMSTGKDKNGSNPKYNGELLNFKKKEAQEEVTNIFA
jgi:hypothetical protein